MASHRYKSQARSQEFYKGGFTLVSDYCKHERLGGPRGILPQEILEIRCSEIVSEAIFGQKQSCSSYIAHGVLHPIFDCPYMQFPRLERRS